MSDTVLNLIKNLILILTDVLQFALLARAILSWFVQDEENKVSVFLLVITEPFILPLRKLFERMHWFERMPLDMPFLMTFFLLAVLQFTVSMSL